MMQADQQDQAENEFRNIKLKLKGPKRHSELQAVKALMAMSAQQNLVPPPVAPPTPSSPPKLNHLGRANNGNSHKQTNNANNRNTGSSSTSNLINSNNNEPIDLSRTDSPEPIYGLSDIITMTEEEFKELAEREGIQDVIGEPICRLCGGLFSGPLGIALHMCPAMKRQTYQCDICGEDKWKTKANLHSHIKWCKKRLTIKAEQHESK